MNDGHEELRAVGQKIAELVAGAPEQERAALVPVARELREELKRVLPAEEPGRTAGIEEVAAVVANVLQGRPDGWHEALPFIISLYFPLGGNSTPVVTGPGEFYIKSDTLAVPITRIWLRNASSAERQRFFTAINDWDMLIVVADALPDIALETTDIAAFLRSADPLTRGDMGRGGIFAKVHAWAGKHRAVAREVVDAWLRQDPGYGNLKTSSIDVLVEGVIAVDKDEVVWRDRVINALVQRRDEDSWRLAAYLACFAWPRDQMPSVTERHAELRKHVERWPERMIDTGLAAMQRDAGEHPVEAVGTALELIGLLPEPRGGESGQVLSPELGRALALAEIANRALWSLKQSGSGAAESIEWARVLDVLVTIPVGYARVLDRFLGGLVKQKLVPRAREFFRTWLAARRHELLSQGVDLEHSFPLFTGSAGTSQLAGWLVEMAVAPDLALRALAVNLLGQQRWFPDEDILSQLSRAQARALAHQLAGSNATGDTWIPLLIRLGSACPGALAEVREILLGEAVLSYPGECEKQLGLWNHVARPAGDESHGRALEEVGRELAGRLQERRQLHERRSAVPEIVTMVPAMELGQEMMRRGMAMADERIRASGRFPFLSMLSQVPIARGQGTVHRVEDQVMRVPFADMRATFEWSFLDSVDPVVGEYRRLVHRHRAEEILRDSSGEREP